MSSPSTSRVLAATLFLVGICQGCKDSPDPPPGALSDVNNFSYSAELQVQAQVLAEHEDSLFDWSALSRDLLGDVVEATDVGEALLLVMPALAHDEVVDKLVTDKLIMADVAGYFLCEPEGTDCNFSEFGIRGSYPGPQNYFIEGSGSWLVVLASDMGLGQVSMLFLEPRADSDSTLASFDDDSASLDLAVDLRSLQPVSVPLDGDLELDWESVSVDGLGNELVHYKLDLLTVARFPDYDLEALEAQLYDLEVLAGDMWQLDITGKLSASLLELEPVTEGGLAFTGFAQPGIWLLALRCSTCFSPAPKILAVLEPASDP